MSSLMDLPAVLGESLGGSLGGSLGARGSEYIVENVGFGVPRAPKPWKTYSLVNPGLRNGEKRERIRPSVYVLVTGGEVS